MKFGVIVFPGSNCDDDMVYVLRELMGQSVVKIWHKEQDLQNADFLVLPGGFAYGDYLRSGAIARFSPVMQAVQKHAQKGAYVLGICNGFQVLCEAHLLPGALLSNTNRQYICKHVHLKPQNQRTPITQGLDLQRTYQIPIAHGDGRFFCSPDALKSILDQEQILFKYVSAQGEIHPEDNPNGSLEDIAGICNAQGNVMGLMPHPERAVDPRLGQSDGKLFFESILAQVNA